MPAKTRKMTTTVKAARVVMRLRATSKLISVTRSNSARLAASAVLAWTVCTALSASEALPELAAIQSWFSRDSARSLRPMTTMGTMMTGTISSTKPCQLGAG